MDNSSTSNSNMVLYNDNQMEFSSPIIPHMQPNPQTFEFGEVFTSIFHLNLYQQRMEKTYYICDYSEDIFQTLRETELNRRLVNFRSAHLSSRPHLLKLLKNATEKHKLARTTLHLAVYLLDCFMDNYVIRTDKLNLTAISCLLIAAKIEEADVNMPKFSDLNTLVDEAYTLSEFKHLECKVLNTFNFDLIRPTAATFAEYFANNFITLQDFHMFVNHWNNEMILNNYHHEQQQNLPNYATCIVLSTPCPYKSYGEMLTTLTGVFFDLIDVFLSYLKFANVRPSIVASSCIAAVRQLHGIFPIWTPYLIKLTHCAVDIILPFVEAILTIYRINFNNKSLQCLQTPNTPLNNTGYAAILYDSPDSGIVSGVDSKSLKSDTDNEHDDAEDDDDDNMAAELNAEIVKQHKNVPKGESDDEDEGYHCFEYPLLAKRRRIF